MYTSALLVGSMHNKKHIENVHENDKESPVSRGLYKYPHPILKTHNIIVKLISACLSCPNK